MITPLGDQPVTGGIKTSVPFGADDSAANYGVSKVNGPVVDINSHRLRKHAREDWRSDDKGGGELMSSIIKPMLEGTSGQTWMPFMPVVQNGMESGVAENSNGSGRKNGLRTKGSQITTPGIKKRKIGKNGDDDMPPTPWGCEWVKTDDGWSLWRYRWDKDGSTGERIKIKRYAGSLSHEAWRVLKEAYDSETFISIIGRRARRYGKR
jgi:hypothetical protein